jgi:predicted F0F1-ATPase subunit
MMDGNKRNELGAAWRDAVALTTLGWDLAIPIFGGALLGHLLDRRLGAGYGFTLGLLALGVLTGFYNVIRSIQRMEAREKRRAAQDETGQAE